MRHIVEQIRHHPPGGGKTVILIDEAHMLSKAALTVLLKPLEETPDHVVILITNEKKEVLNTTFLSLPVHQFRPIKREEPSTNTSIPLLVKIHRLGKEIREAFRLKVRFKDRTISYLQDEDEGLKPFRGLSTPISTNF